MIRRAIKLLSIGFYGARQAEIQPNRRPIRLLLKLFCESVTALFDLGPLRLFTRLFLVRGGESTTCLEESQNDQ
jgi:hypothetical protein